MTAVDPVPRRSPSKKRHTKPCRYFQVNQCPFSADACDFAHVLVVDCPPPPPTPSFKRRPCRFFVAGHCSQGASCRFRHVLEGSEDEKRISGNRKTDRTRTKDGATTPPFPETPDFMSNDYTPVYEPDTFISSPGPLYPLSPGYLPWSPYGAQYAYGSNSPEDSLATLTSPTATASSSDSATGIHTPSGSSSSMTDDLVITTVQTLQIRPSHTSSPVTGLPTTPINSGSVHTPTSFTSPRSAFFPDHARWPTRPQNRPIRSQSLSNMPSTKQKLSFRTKPCKFYKADGTCPKGDACTFIHDAKATERAPVQERNPDPVESRPSAPLSQQPESSPASKVQHELPRKPTSVQEENKKKGFYPISWRVIGGGVLIGGKTSQPSGESGEAQALTMSDEGIAEDEDARATPTLSGGGTVDREATPLGKDVPISVVTGTVSPGPGLPDSTSFAEREKLAPGRARAKSISPIPTAERVDILALFSAESPGGL